jgi:hypothetical protein
VTEWGGKAWIFWRTCGATPRFQDYWLDYLRPIDGDLALGDQGIADADPAVVSSYGLTKDDFRSCWKTR